VIVHSEDVEKGRLPGPRRTHDGNEIAFLHFEIDVAQDVKEFAFREWINALDVLQSNEWIDHR
jgi:hypothetical protein